MKTILNLKTLLIAIFVCNLQATIINPQFSSNLYAQDSKLFEHTWHLEKINIDSDEYILANYYAAESAIAQFDEKENLIFISLCEFMCFWGTTSYDGNSLMNLSEIDECALTGECTSEGSDLYFYRDLYFSIFHFWDSASEMEVIKNPFTYTIQTVDDYHQLTIENGAGDWAVYSSMSVSTPGFRQSSFAIYPNPVQEVLHIDTALQQSVETAIYDLNGKRLQSQAIETGTATLDVKQLPPGLYFIVFENENGARVSKKFVKH